MFWFNKENPDVDFCDIREEKIVQCDGRTITIAPDYIADVTDLPFEDESYYLVVFDPPHLRWAGKKSYMAQHYGQLPKDWEPFIKQGFDECMRVLKPNGVLIFKWGEKDLKVSEILRVIGRQPLFGHKSGKAQRTHWMCFIK